MSLIKRVIDNDGLNWVTHLMETQKMISSIQN